MFTQAGPGPAVRTEGDQEDPEDCWLLSNQLTQPCLGLVDYDHLVASKEGGAVPGTGGPVQHLLARQLRKGGGSLPSDWLVINTPQLESVSVQVADATPSSAPTTFQNIQDQERSRAAP